MNKQVKEDLIRLLNEKSIQANSPTKKPHDFSGLKDTVLQMELKQEIEVLFNLLSDIDTFEEKFKERCHWRMNSPEHSISFKMMPMSITNQLYWDIATLVFKPKTMKDMIHILLGNNMINLCVEWSDLPKQRHSKSTKEYFMSMNPVLVEDSHLERLTEHPTLEALSHFSISDNLLFNVGQIINFPLQFHAKLQESLTKKYPELAKILYEHNLHLKH